MNFHIGHTLTAAMVLFAVIDIIGSIPIIIQLKQKAGHIHAGRATLVSLVILLAFLLLGESILKVIGLDVGSFAIAGSFILFLLAIEMIFGIRIDRDHMPQTASIVPLAFPLIAGAGTMTTILSLRAEYAAINIIVAIALNMLVVFIVLRLVGRIEKLLGPIGIAITRKVFGVILLAIAVKLFRTNVGI